VQSDDLRGRDAQTAYLLGGFLAVFALPVLAGALMAELPIDRLLALFSGLTLLAVAFAFLAWGRRRQRAARGGDAP
jgi:hypothetical protein